MEMVEALYRTLRRVMKRIASREKELLKATEANKSAQYIAYIEQERDDLVKTREKLMSMLSSVAIPSDEALLLPYVDWCNDSQLRVAQCPMHAI